MVFEDDTFSSTAQTGVITLEKVVHLHTVHVIQAVHMNYMLTHTRLEATKSKRRRHYGSGARCGHWDHACIQSLSIMGSPCFDSKSHCESKSKRDVQSMFWH